MPRTPDIPRTDPARTDDMPQSVLRASAPNRVKHHTSALPRPRQGIVPDGVVLPAALAAFVAGVIALQQGATLPAPWMLATLGGAACSALFAARFLPHVGVPAVGGSGTQGARIAAILLAAAALGFAYAGLRAHVRLADALAYADEGRDLRVRGIVATLPAQYEDAVRFEFAVEKVLDSRVHVPAHIALTWHRPPPTLLPAQRWEFSVRLRRPQGLCNPGGFDAEAWMLEAGIRAQGSVRTGRRERPPVLVAQRVWRFDPLIDRARAVLRARLERALGSRRYRPVIVALVMGDQGGISQDDWALFNRTGVSHLISISGLHITMIAGAVALLAGGLWRRSAALLRIANVQTVRAAAGMTGGWAYCLLAGWGVPAQRTLLMLGVVAAAVCLRVRPGSATILAAAAALVCLWDPWAVLAAGFWLSFGAVACILFASSGRVHAGSERGAALREAVRAQAAITVGQVPLTLAIFGQVSLAGPIANAVAIPLVSYVVAPLALGGAALLGFGAPGRWAGTELLHGAERVFAALAWFLHRCTAPSWSWMSLPVPPLWTIVAATLGCAWLLAPGGWPAPWAGLCWLAPMFLWPVPRPAPGDLWVTALDVGQGMGVVLETADAVAIFDTGPRDSPSADAGSRVIAPYLRMRGVRRIDALIVSHRDRDHAGGAASLLAAFPVGQVWSSVAAGDPLLAGARTVHRCRAGARFAAGSIAFSVLSPPASIYTRRNATTNERSCVVLARVGAHRVLLTGDVPVREERALVQAAAFAGRSVHADLMLAPHHGSRSSSSDDLLAAVAPRWASVQDGYRNRYHHPDPTVLARYAAHGIPVLRSDRLGAVRWRWSTRGTTLERWRIDHRRYWYNLPGPSTGTMAKSGRRDAR